MLTIASTAVAIVATMATPVGTITAANGDAASTQPRPMVRPLGAGGLGTDVTVPAGSTLNQVDSLADEEPDDMPPVANPDDAPMFDSDIKWRNDAKLNKVAGATLKSYTAIQKYADSDGCGRYISSATIDKKPVFIRNDTNWWSYGVMPSLSVSSSGPSGSVQASGTSSPYTYLINDKGQKGSYLNGSVCMSRFTFYVGQHTKATTKYNGNFFSIDSQIQ